MMAHLADDLLAIYGALRGAFGHQHWWPAETAFEAMIGAILAQNVSWKNAAKAVRNLRMPGCSIRNCLPPPIRQRLPG